MADDIDRASELEAWSRENALKQQRERAGFAEPADWERRSAKWCIETDCGERIPDSRRKALPGVKRCVTCQETKERRTRK
jgi:phage/conjugal plasmid C-4 type zinc finger TraR family protein